MIIPQELPLNVREEKLRWFDHIRKRWTSTSMRMVESLLIGGFMRRGRPKRTLEQQLRLDLKTLDLNEIMTADRCFWRRHIRVVNSLLAIGHTIGSLK
ncbi:hypothetical protein OROGR_007655 [Orobanche gracilis]